MGRQKRMKFARQICLSILPVMVFCIGLKSNAYADGKFVALGTSSKSGVYYPVGQGICGLINSGRNVHLVRCLPYATGGSIYNIQALQSGELDVAITRADLAYLAATGQGVFKATGAVPGLRILASLYDNPVGVIVHKDSNIQNITDVLGTRINIGNVGSGKRDFSDLLFEVMGWQYSDFESVGEMSTSKMGKAFCAGDTDVLIQAMGIPAKFYDNIINNCDGRFVPISSDVITKLKQKAPFLEATTIPGGMYDSNPNDVSTIGTKAVLVTMDRLPENTVYQISASIYSHIKQLREKHASLKTATIELMANMGIYVPFHQGAVQYFKDNGISFRQVGGS